MQIICVFLGTASHNGPVMFKFNVHTLTEITHGLLWKKARVTATFLVNKQDNNLEANVNETRCKL